MPASARLFALVFLGILATSETSVAQTVSETASEWGLLGTWRTDCGAPVSLSYGVYRYVVREGKLFHDREFGDADTRDSSLVMSATTKADGSIEIVINFVSISQIRSNSFIKGIDGRIRVISSRDVNTNEYTVRGGKLTSNDNATPWLTRCR